ncbi:MAG: metallophosphoesterase, partial [Bacteroidales bacterium]|nr:metallophosphoesterase [Bacteroidales bacterium]
MARTYVIGDIHGAYLALVQCLEKSGFDYKSDTLICLGDVTDGWPEVHLAIEELLKVKKLIFLLGNHDSWALGWFLTGNAPDIWVSQGGKATITSYPGEIPKKHIKLLQSARLYYEFKNKLFVHGGFDPMSDISHQTKETLIWDRNLLESAIELQEVGINKVTKYDEVYIGHTPTINFGKTEPMKICEIYLMDTGAGWRGGVLTMMNIDTKEMFSSDRV